MNTAQSPRLLFNEAADEEGYSVGTFRQKHYGKSAVPKYICFNKLKKNHGKRPNNLKWQTYAFVIFRTIKWIIINHQTNLMSC